MQIHIDITQKWKILLVLVSLAIIAGCAGLQEQSKPAAVPEIQPGILAGYLYSHIHSPIAWRFFRRLLLTALPRAHWMKKSAEKALPCAVRRAGHLRPKTQT